MAAAEGGKRESERDFVNEISRRRIEARVGLEDEYDVFF
jgi:hypothetical protein